MCHPSGVTSGTEPSFRHPPACKAAPGQPHLEYKWGSVGSSWHCPGDPS